MTGGLPRALLLDLDDTILHYGAGGDGLWREVVGSFAAALPVAPVCLLEAIDAVRGPFWADPRRSRVARQDMFAARRTILAEAFGRLGLPRDGELVREVADAFSAAREARVEPFPGAVEALAELRRRGHALGLLTNGGARLQRAKLERHDLARLFDSVRIEGEVGVGKARARRVRNGARGPRRAARRGVHDRRRPRSRRRWWTRRGSRDGLDRSCGGGGPARRPGAARPLGAGPCRAAEPGLS